MNKGFISEMRKMRWAKPKEVLQGTISVIAVSIVVFIYFLIADMGIMAFKNIWNGLF